MPRNKWFFQSGTVGEFTSAGLPNIEGKFSSTTRNSVHTITVNGAFKSLSTQGWTLGGGGGSAEERDYSFDASKSNSVYGNSITVQPNSISCYLMMYVN